MLVAPDSLDKAGWNLQADGPEFLRQVIEAVVAGGGIDGRRMYLFGHSAGGHQALDIALLESEYFAAAAVHAGVLTDPGMILPRADRKIPLAMWNGTADQIVPIDMARSTLALLKARGFPAALTEMPGHTHDYYGSAGQVNAAAWQMLKTEKLDADPKFKTYQFK